MRRHFTVTGFVVEDGRTLLHWHQKTQLWLPPGGHVEPDEDPVQAVLREVREETGLETEVIGPAAFAFAVPPQLPPPITILVEDIPATPREDAHQHIDHIYAVRRAPGSPAYGGSEFTWVDERQLRADEALPVASCGVDVRVSEDVRVLALHAITLERQPRR